MAPYVRRKDLIQVGFSAGFLAAAVTSLIRSSADALGYSDFSMALILGSFVTGTLDGRVFVGLPVQYAIGGIIGMLYGLGFAVLKKTNTAMGALFGVMHWIVAGVMLSFLPLVHPLIPEVIPAPGALAANTGVFDFTLYFLNHLFFGAIVGFCCEIVVVRRAERRQRDELVKQEFEKKRAA